MELNTECKKHADIHSEQFEWNASSMPKETSLSAAADPDGAKRSLKTRRLPHAKPPGVL